jgi:hypothetical protein
MPRAYRRVRSWVGVLLLAVCVAVCGCGASQTVTPASLRRVPPVAGGVVPRVPRATRAIGVRPTNAVGDLKRTYVVSDEARGQCVPSAKSAGGETFSCTAGSTGYEPCWPGALKPPTTLYCMAAPWQHRVTRFHVTAPPARGYIGKSSPLWALELVGGERCDADEATPSEVDGKDARWECSQHIGLLEQPARAHPLWTIREVFVNPASRHLRLGPVVEVAAAWYAEANGATGFH